MSADAYFLPYQARYIQDRARFKAAEKSRRIGWAYGQSYEDTRDAARKRGPLDVWFSSADESAAKEYIRYVAQWARIFNIAATDLGEIALESDKDVKALAVEFATGKRITALTSNPKAFRSKGGKLVLDEFAFHPDQDAMWKAARPIITWGFPVRVISTYNGKGNRYYRLISDIKKELAHAGRSRWSLHSVTIEQAVAEGLADRIVMTAVLPRVDKGLSVRGVADLTEELEAEVSAASDLADVALLHRLKRCVVERLDGSSAFERVRLLSLSEDERQTWIDEERATAGDEETWQQEYMCIPVDEATAWLTWELIISAEHAEAGLPGEYAGGPCFVGVDIGRRRDLYVIWVLEKIGDIYWTREVVALQKARFSLQAAELARVFATYDVRRCCMDQGGMGEKPVEDAKDAHGAYRVEGVIFSNTVKIDLATRGKQRFEDKRVRTPVDKAIRASHHAVRKLTTTAGNVRFDAERSEVGHADEFWAHMLALHATDDQVQPAAGASVDQSADTYRTNRGSARRRAAMLAGRL